MSKLDDIGIVDACDCTFGSKRRYPTREDFIDAVRQDIGVEVDPDEVTEKYARRCRTPEGYEAMWQFCDGPAKCAEPIWECS